MAHSNRWDDAAIIALGSNLPGVYPTSRALLEAALKRFPEEGIDVALRSRWWRSASWPDQAGPDYLNGVAFVETRLSPVELMTSLLRLEAEFGRSRAVRNGPRTLDLDLIAYGRVIVDGPDLVLPHPRASLRRFVIGPIAEVAPEWSHPVSALMAKDLLDRCTIGLDALAEV